MDFHEIMVTNVLMNVRKEMSELNDRDSINKLYRQARIWVRFHCYYANACTPEETREINRRLKNMRWDRLEDLGFEVWRGGEAKIKEATKRRNRLEA